MDDVVKLPELVTLIFSKIDKPSTVYHCALVNRLWNRCAIPILWRGVFTPSEWETPSLDEIARSNISLENLQSYLQYTRFFRLGTGAPVSELKETSLRLLRDGYLVAPQALSMEADLTSIIMNDESMTPLLVPSLRLVSLYGGKYTAQFPQTLLSRCPMLESLLLDNTSDCLTAMDIYDACFKLPRLKHLELIQLDWERAGEAFVKLLALGTLKSLILGSIEALDPLYLQSSLNDMSISALHSLRHLMLGRVSGRNLKLLLPLLQNLQSADFGLYDPFHNPISEVFQPLCHCKGLLEVTVNVHCEALIVVEDMLPFVESCKKLTALVMNCNETIPFVMDSHLASWKEFIRNLPHLEILELVAVHRPGNIDLDGSVDRSGSLGDEEFYALADACPSLRVLDMNFDLTELTYTHYRPTLPYLQELSITGFRELGPTLSKIVLVDRAEEIIQYLEEKMPRLNDFSAKWNDFRDGKESTGHRMIRVAIEERNVPKAQQSESVQNAIRAEIFADCWSI